MRISPLDIKQHQFKKRFRGYDPYEVDAFLEVIAETLEGFMKKTEGLEGELQRMAERLEGYEGKERLLRETITTAQRMVEDMRNNALKEAELIVSEAKTQANKLVREAQEMITNLQGEVYQLKRQRLELQNSIRSILDYHNNLLHMEGEKD